MIIILQLFFLNVNLIRYIIITIDNIIKKFLI